MKFVSKNANLCVMLKHGIPAEPITGRQGVPGFSVRFVNGVANISDTATIPNDVDKTLVIDALKRHTAFNSDFICAENDPYIDSRSNKEPEHDMSEILYGHMGKNLNPKPAAKMSAEQKKLIKDLAVALAKEIAPQMAKDALAEMIKDMKAKAPGVTPVSETEKFICPNCGKEAVNKAGLSAHVRTCTVGTTGTASTEEKPKTV